MKRLLLIIFGLSIGTNVFAQNLPDLFNKDIQVTWLGIDYSQAKIIGEWSQFNGAGDYSPGEVRDKYYPAWNNLILTESAKYNLKEMIRQDDINIDIGMVMERNAAVSRRDLEAYSAPNYTADQIQEFVSSYDLSGKSGIGMVFINEHMSKNTENAVFHLVLLDLSSKQILIHEEVTARPRGFGIRNYWAGAIYKFMEEIRTKHYPRWKKEYGR